jgi:hypothetical protein
MNVATLVDAVNTLDVDEIAALGLDDALTVYVALTDAHQILGQVLAQLPNVLAAEWGEKVYELPGVGVFELHAKKRRTRWDREGLLRDVKDARVVDETTGEVVDHLAKVLRVWNLGAPRVTALRALGLDPDDYCTSEWAGYTIQRIG